MKGTWLQIQCGNYVLPEEKDKEAATNGVFFVDPVSQQFISDIISLVCGHGLFKNTYYQGKKPQRRNYSS